MFIEDKKGDKTMQSNFDTRIQLDEVHQEESESVLLSLACEYADWLESQLFGRLTANADKNPSLNFIKK